ncbi:MAG: helix-turn-helix domain-containing protein [Ruminococcaceae bacterium]|nr:helix-turn-helix domain-containing protein [Oscillospiraceae bacterium]
MTIDEILKAIRKELNISQETLARYLNVSFATLNRWENGRNIPSRLALAQLKEFAAQNNMSEEVTAAIEKIRI